MDKSTAISHFGSATSLARALGITPQAVYQWPEQLDQRRADLVLGAMVRLGMKLPGAIEGSPATVLLPNPQPAGQEAA